MLRAIFICLLLFSSPVLADDPFARAFRLADKNDWDEALAAAESTRNRPLIDYVTWRAYKDYGRRPPAGEILDFIERHPYWPDIPVLLDRAGDALLLQGMHPQSVGRWHRIAVEHGFVSADGNPADILLKDRWARGDFTNAEQKELLRTYANHLTVEDIVARTDTLLWRGQSSLTFPLHGYLPRAEHKLVNARIALMTNQRGVETAIREVPANLRNHPSLLYERLRWRARKKLDDGVLEILRQAPEAVPYPEKWWQYRALHARNALESGDYKGALTLLNNHGQQDDAPLAEALWVRGWLQLQFLNNPREAYKDFYALYHHVSYPVSLSRGAYWAGKAALINGNGDIAANWFKVAAQHSTTFYGQLAQLELAPGQKLQIPVTPVSGNVQMRHADRELLELIQLLSTHEQNLSVRQFLGHLAKLQKKPEEFIALGRFAAQMGYPHLMVQIGKKASQSEHYWLPEITHPMREVPHHAIEPALALAITRQESEFNPSAKSTANALGMMQLLPSTAKLTAKKHAIGYDYNNLFDPDYNMTLGIHYLAGLVNLYDGSYPLAIAAYNAGPGNVGRWIKKFGRPGPGLDNHLLWMERIPFSETRNYVQRVLENLQVYRELLGDQQGFTVERALGQ